MVHGRHLCGLCRSESVTEQDRVNKPCRMSTHLMTQPCQSFECAGLQRRGPELEVLWRVSALLCPGTVAASGCSALGSFHKVLPPEWQHPMGGQPALAQAS